MEAAPRPTKIPKPSTHPSQHSDPSLTEVPALHGTGLILLHNAEAWCMCPWPAPLPGLCPPTAQPIGLLKWEVPRPGQPIHTWGSRRGELTEGLEVTIHHKGQIPPRARQKPSDLVPPWSLHRWACTWVHSLNVPSEHTIDHSVHHKHGDSKEQIEVIPFHRGLAERVPLDAHTCHFI